MIQHILYLSDDTVSFMHWRDSQLIALATFDKEENDIDHFKQVLNSISDTPIKIVISLQEEDYQRETIPYTSKKDQQAIAKRLLEKYYRDSEYSHAEIQGRNADGRKDSRVLLSSVNIEDSLKKYITTIIDCQKTIAGIWSAPLLGENLIQSIDEQPKNYILLYKENQYYRESIYINNELITSRKISHIKYKTFKEKAHFIVSSIDLLHKFTTNKRLIGFQEKIEVICATKKELFDETSSLNNSENIIFKHLDIEKVIQKNQYNMVKDTISDDIIYGFLCSNKDYRNPHYKKDSEIKPFKILKFNKLLHKSLYASITILTLISGSLFIDNIHLKKLSNSLEKDRNNFLGRYQDNFDIIQNKIDHIETIEETLTTSNDIISRSKSSPTDIFLELSHILDEDRFHNISIDKIHWKKYSGYEYESLSKRFPKDPFENQHDSTDIEDESYEYLDDAEQQPKQFVHISGSFDYEHLDYATSVDTMLFFNNALKSISNFQDVYMVHTPIDIRAHTNFIDFIGSLDNSEEKSKNYFEFIVSVVHQENEKYTQSF